MKRCLMIILLIALLTPMIYATPTTPEPSVQELYSAIDPNLFYPGSAVKEFAEKIFQEADIAIRGAYYQGMIDGAAQAAVPLLIKIEGLEAWKDGAEDKLAGSFLKTVLFMSGSLVFGYLIGTALK